MTGEGSEVASVSSLFVPARVGERLVKGLPASEMLLRSVRESRPAGHPLDRPVRRLAELHTGAARSRESDHLREVDASRREVVRMIDRWVEANVPQHRHGAAIHTETVGSVIDRLIAAYARSAYLLETNEAADSLAVHAAWFRVAELVNGYDDLVAAIMHGERRLPTST